MSNLIPFVTGKTGAYLANQIYGDSEVRRLSLSQAAGFCPTPPESPVNWLDPSVDGLDNLSTRETTPERKNQWFEYMNNFKNFDLLGSLVFHSKPDKEIVKAFVGAILNEAAKFNPSWISIPSLPLIDGAGRNKINFLMAEATSEWKASSGFAGRLILPLVVLNLKTIRIKTLRTPKIDQAAKCYEASGASGYWAVLKNLKDDNGSPAHRSRTFPAIKDFHDELKGRLQPEVSVGGPYWGLNLILWASGRITHPAIGIGSGYQYFLAGGHANTPSSRVAIPSLLRRVLVVPELKEWLEKSIQLLPDSEPARQDFIKLRDKFSLLSSTDLTRKQVAQFYKKWFDGLAIEPPAARSSALFSQLSAAYALGRRLPDLSGEGTARRPEAVAESLMLSCL